jgi:hypothetical protein
MNKTILYYTSNQEDPGFERKIREDLLSKCGNLPIVSVSQKPIDLGQNICVGDIGFSYKNEFKQILIGAKAATTEYLVFAESDFLYPPEYFSFTPTGGDIYRYDNIWLVFNHAPKFYKRMYSNGAQIVTREFIIPILERYDSWKKDYDGAAFELFHGDNPCLSFKTGKGMTKSNSVFMGKHNQKDTLPYWGSRRGIGRKYLW